MGKVQKYQSMMPKQKKKSGGEECEEGEQCDPSVRALGNIAGGLMG
jgi:hypothetical protein